MFRFSVVILLITALSSCSSLDYREKALVYSAAAGATGYLIGSGSAKEGESEAMHGALWGSLAALTVSTAFLYFMDHEKSIRERRVKDFNAEGLESFKNNINIDTKSGSAGFKGNDLPEDVNGLIVPGNWKLYKIDEWVKLPNNKVVHQDKLLEFNPPKLNERKIVK